MLGARPAAIRSVLDDSSRACTVPSMSGSTALAPCTMAGLHTIPGW
jgi:hypothetical protein